MLPTSRSDGEGSGVTVSGTHYCGFSAGAVVGMLGQDYYPQGKRSWIRLYEKGGKFHEVPCHHKAEEYLFGCLS